MTRNDFYPIIRMKHFLESQFFSNSEIKRKFNIIGKYRTKVEGVNLVETKDFDFISCKLVNSGLKDYEIHLTKDLASVIQEEGLCPNLTDEELNEMDLFGNLQSSEFRILSIVVYPCKGAIPSTCDAVDVTKDYELFFTSVSHSFEPYNKNNPYTTQFNMDQSFPYKRTNYINRIYRFEKFELYDEGFDFKDIFLKDSHSDITDIQSNTINRVNDESSHVCTVTEVDNDECIPYVTLNLESSKKMTTTIRIHPTLVGIMGEVGGTCEIIVFFSALAYALLFRAKNVKNENEQIWNLSQQDKNTYELLTNHVIEDNEIEETRKRVVKKTRNGANLSKTVAVVELLARRVFSRKERDNINLAIFDSSIFTQDKSSKMHLDNLEKNKSESQQ